MDRVANQVLDILCGILTKNIDLSQLGFVTFTHVDISPDLRSAKVFYSVLGRKKSDEEINIEKRDLTRDNLFKLTGGYTVPQIIINNIPIGGFNELLKLLRSVTTNYIYRLELILRLHQFF